MKHYLLRAETLWIKLCLWYIYILDQESDQKNAKCLYSHPHLQRILVLRGLLLQFDILSRSLRLIHLVYPENFIEIERIWYKKQYAEYLLGSVILESLNWITDNMNSETIMRATNGSLHIASEFNKEKKMNQSLDT